MLTTVQGLASANKGFACRMEFQEIEAEIGLLTSLERQVVENGLTGKLTIVGQGSVPQARNISNQIRAEFISYLCRNGARKNLVSDFGIQIKGAFISGELNLSGVVLTYGIRLINCIFDERIYAPSAKVDRVSLQGSQVSGLYLERARINGYLLCNKGFASSGKITLIGARIDGTVSFAGANIRTSGPIALSANRCKITDSLYFNQGFSANGRLNLLGAQIGGQLSFGESLVCTDHKTALNAQRANISETLFIHNSSEFVGDIKLTGAKVGGQLILRDLQVKGNSKSSGSISMDNASISNALVVKRVAVVGTIDLSQSSAGSLNDDNEVWRSANAYHIEGFTYGRLHSEAYDFYERLAWIQKASPTLSEALDDDSSERLSSDHFTPQPYQQLASVLMDMGHRRDRNLVLFSMEKQTKEWQFRSLLRRRDLSLDGSVRAGFGSFAYDVQLLLLKLSSVLLRYIVGFGYRPQNAVICAVLVISLTAFLVSHVYNAGDFTPTAAPILVSERWQQVAVPIEQGGLENPAEFWTAKSEQGRDYTTFNPLYYAADLFIPLVEFGQDSDWAPSTSRSDAGRFLHVVEPLIRLLGWVVTALGAAALAGIVRND